MSTLNLKSESSLASLEKQWWDAVDLNDTAAVKALLEKGANPNWIRGISDQIALADAILKDNLDLIEHLFPLSHPIVALRWSALSFSIRKHCSSQVIQRLAGLNGPDPMDYPTQWSPGLNHPWTPLMHAAYVGNYEAVQLLLPQSQVNAISDEGDNALMLAAGTGNLRCVQALIPYTTPPLQPNSFGENAINLAEQEGYTQTSLWIKQYLRASEEHLTLQQCTEEHYNDPASSLIPTRLKPRI